MGSEPLKTLLRNTLNVISLGAGVQSSTMALMAKHGEITPMPDCAIFADTQGEPKNVYDWLGWLEKQLPFPTHRVTAGSLEDISLTVVTGKSGKKYTKKNIPAFTLSVSGKKGMTQRQCTYDFKVLPIRRKIRELVGRKGKASQWIGISYDEVERMKPSFVNYITNAWPLIDKKMTRQDCLNWMKKNNYPTPPRSACYFCPLHSNYEWDHLSDDDKLKAQEYEEKLQNAYKQIVGLDSIPYLHQSRKPLSLFLDKPNDVDLFDNQFKNECEGHCGV